VCGHMYEDREKKSMDTCAEEDKIGEKKTKMIIKSETYGWKNKIKNKGKIRKRFWVGLNSFQITKILINFKTKIRYNSNYIEFLKHVHKTNVNLTPC